MTESHWQSLLRASVSPLRAGTASLDVYGWRPAGRESERPRRTAAVLVGVLDGPDPEVILTRRSERLAQHPGQVAFPGGSVDDVDRTGVSTALREAEEEIGLLPERVEAIGFLDRIDTISDFRVLPVVGVVRPGADFVPDLNEVDEVFTLPLNRALDPEAWAPTRIHRDGVTRVIYSMQWQAHTIWGVTAAILRNLAERVRQQQALASRLP